jgi:hypothetical protein
LSTAAKAQRQIDELANCFDRDKAFKQSLKEYAIAPFSDAIGMAHGGP